MCLALFSVAFTACGGSAAPELLPFEVAPDPSSAGWRRPAVVLLVVIDTLRADHVGSYGGSRDLTPHLDWLAQRSFLFARAMAPSSWTRPSVASLFTSRYPASLQVQGRRDALSEAHLTLAELYAGEGWDTLAVSTNGNAGAQFGFDQGFDQFLSPGRTQSYPGDFPMQVAQGVTEAALDRLHRLRTEPSPRPLFLFLHYTDPHDPYLLHPELDLGQPEPTGRFSGSRNDLRRMDRLAASALGPADIERIRYLYAGEVRYCDAWIGELFEGLKGLDLWRDTLVLVTADHGEGLWDHGERRHGKQLYEEEIRVPLILHYPGMEESDSARVETNVSLVDVPATLLAVSGIERPASFEGHDLAPLTRGEERPAPLAAIHSELILDGRWLESLLLDRWKLIRPRGMGRLRQPVTQLFDLAADPGERRNLARVWRRNATERRLRAALEAWHDSLATRVGPSREVRFEDLDESTVRQLQALGYLE